MKHNDQNGRFTLFEIIVQKGVKPETLQPEIFTVISDRIEDALADRKSAGLDVLSAELAAAFGELARRAPADALDAVRNAVNASPASLASFVLGQLNFAHHFVSQVALKRVDDKFTDVIFSRVNAPLIKALLKGEMTQVALAEKVGKRAETISRNLRDLREIGAIDYRRNGVSFLNFLTPVVYSVPNLDERLEAACGVASSDRGKSEALRQLYEQLDPIWQSPQPMVPPSSGLGASEAAVEVRAH